MSHQSFITPVVTVLETDHLILRTWIPTDTLPFVAMNADPEVMRYFPRLRNLAETESLIAHINQQYLDFGYTLYAVELKKIGQFIGFTGLNRTPFTIPTLALDKQPAIEIGWRLAKAYWNQGYATEAATAVLDHAINQLKLSEIVSFCVVNNLPSRRVMEKIGLLHIPSDDFNHPLIEHDSPYSQHVLYRVTADDYHK